MERTVEGSETAGYIGDIVPEVVAALSQEELSSREAVEAEIDLMLRMVRQFWEMEPDQVMRACSALTARCTELHIHLHRVEGRFREWRQVRTQQVDKLVEELERQHKNHSRIVEMRRQDLDQMRGG